MANLVDVTDLLTRMSLSTSLSGHVNSGESVLAQATEVLKNRIGSDFDRYERKDFFSHKARTPFEPFRIKLSQGFVDEAESFVIYEKSINGELLDTTDGVVLDTKYYVVDYEKGTVTMNRAVPTAFRSFIAHYTAGFTDNGGTPPIYDTPVLPSWLPEAAIVTAGRLWHSGSAHVSADKVKDISPEVARSMQFTINSHIRPRGGFDRPVDAQTV